MAASVFLTKQEHNPECFVYLILTLFVVQLSCFRTATTELLGNETVWISFGSQEFNQFTSSEPSSCNQYIQRFSNASSNFILCASTSAKPVTFCEKCADQYQEVIKVVTDINKDMNCRDKILNSDILQIVKKTHKFVKDLWADGNCAQCFVSKPNSEVTYNEFSNKTMVFQAQYNDTQECFKTYGSTELDIYGGDYTRNKTVCKKCEDDYRKLNKLYRNMGSFQHMCMDLVEMMNVTRQKWNKFKCTEHKKDYTAVYSISISCCCLPIFFYLFAMFITRKKVIRGTDLSLTMKTPNNAGSFGSNAR